LYSVLNLSCGDSLSKKFEDCPNDTFSVNVKSITQGAKNCGTLQVLFCTTSTPVKVFLKTLYARHGIQALKALTHIKKLAIFTPITIGGVYCIDTFWFCKFLLYRAIFTAYVKLNYL